jgi:hypothetical protein
LLLVIKMEIYKIIEYNLASASFTLSRYMQ